MASESVKSSNQPQQQPQTRKFPRSRIRVPNKSENMAAFITPPPPKETIRVRQFNICQYDLLGSTQVCTAIAVVAAREFHRVQGSYDEIFRTDSQVMEILSEGVVWHSRWLALDTDGSRTAFEADTEGDDADPNLVSMATPDEICALPAMDMEVTDVRYEGTLIPQAGRDHYGYSVTEAINFIFNPPERPAHDEDEFVQSQNSSVDPSPLPVSKDTPISDEFQDPAASSSSLQHTEQSPPKRPPPPVLNGRTSPSVTSITSRQPQAQQQHSNQKQTVSSAQSSDTVESSAAYLRRVSADFFGNTNAKSTGSSNTKKSTPTEKVDTYIFTSRGYSTLIARKGNTAMVFDSHQRDKRGMANKEEGKAVCIFCDGPHALARYIRALYGTKPLSLFTLQQVVPRESAEKIQYGATSVIVKPKPATPPSTPTSMSSMAANAGNVAAARIAELSASIKKLSFFKDAGGK